MVDAFRNRAANRRGGLARFLIVILALTGSTAFAGNMSPGVNVTVQENTSARIILQYQLADYSEETVAIDGKAYTHVMLGKEAPMLVTGAPELPHVCRSIIIPDDEEMAVKVTAAEYQDIEGVDVAPSKGNLSRTVNPEDVPYTFGRWYAANAFYPGEVAALGEPYILRDQRGVVVELKPFQYNPVRRTLRVYKSVTLEVTAVGPSQVNVLDRSTRSGEISLAFHNIYQAHFLNYDPPSRYAPLDEVGGMLIICYDAWLTNVAPLVTHKNSIGITTTAVGVSTIGNNATSIKSYIQTQYNTGNIAFVLLVGDAAQVATPSTTYGTETGASDPTYSLLAGSDNYPDIMVGRFSAETAAQVDTQVQRSVEYENLPATQQAWFWKGLGIGSEFGGSGQGDDNEADYTHIGNIRTLLLGHGYTLVDGLYGPSSPTAAQVSTSLNSGRGIINYCGHGSDTSWGTTGFSNTNVAALTNDNMLPFIFSVACVNGNFPGQTCFAEAWMRSTRSGEPIGAIGTYMSSINQDWNPPMHAQDVFGALYTAATPAYNCYGTLCYAGSCGMMDSYGATSGAAGAGMFLTWHVFGDPSLRVVGVVAPPTGLAVTPADGLTSSGGAGGPFTPSSKVYTLHNQGSTSINYTVSKVASWVTLSGTSGTLAGGASTNITVSIGSGANSLAVGSYSDTVTFTNTTDHVGDTTRPVSLQVLPALTVTPVDGLTAAGPVGGTFSPSSKVYTLQNVSGASIDYTVSKNASWVTLSGAGGTIAANGSTTITVSINSTANSLAVGSYNDTVTFTNTTNHSGDTTRPVSLTVNPLSNDLCANALVICPGTYTGTTVGMALESGVSVSCDGSSPGADVWYKYTPGSTGSATISLCSSSTTWDSVLSVHTGVCPGTTQVGCSDDTCGGTGTHGTITTTLTGGTTYLIRIGGYASTNSGPFTLTITGPACASSDSTPPTPNPMTFATPPAPAGINSISMTASTASDPTTPINYFFHIVSGSGADSGWQSGTAYTNTGLTPNTSYSYQVKARDGATPTPNETAYSTPAASTATLIETPTGVSFGTVTNNSIVLNAGGTLTNLTTATSGVYFNSITSGGNGGLNAWVQVATDTAIGLSPNTSYTFQAKARNQNSVETAYSATAAKVTLANVPTAPTLSGATRTTLSLDVNANSNPVATEFAIMCTGSTPTDVSWNGKYVTAAGAASATAVWRTDAQWAVTTIAGLQSCSTYTFAVKARNSALVETALGSSASLATSGRLGDMDGDGVVAGDDIQAFVICTIPGGTGCPCANMSISAFVDCLLNAGTCP
jgi:gingipain R